MISGSDTGVGKTLVAAGLIRALRTRGVDAVGYKPVESGCSDTSEPTDGNALWQASEGVEDLAIVCPVRLIEPLAPNLAARAQDLRLHESSIRSGFERLAARHDLVVVEGAGGACSPLTDRWLSADMAKDLDIPVLVVVPDRLGAINQALSASACLEMHGARTAAVILNASTEETDGSSAGNKAEIERLLKGVPVIRVGFLGGSPDQDAVESALVGAMSIPDLLPVRIEPDPVIPTDRSRE